MQHAHLLFAATAGLYALSAVFHLWELAALTKWSSRLAFFSAACGLAANTAIIALIAAATHRLPFPGMLGSLTFLAWAMAAIYLLMRGRYRISALGVYVCIAAAGIVAFAAGIPADLSAAANPVLRSRWSGIHITSCIIGYAALSLAFGAALAYMLQEWLLKRKRLGALHKTLPPLDVTDRVAYKMASLGFALLTLGIITGALWAQPAWGRFWGWDPKETWSLITWLVYAAYLHVRIVHKWRGKWANRLLVAGFACVVVTYLGVNFLGSGLHQYK